MNLIEQFAHDGETHVDTAETVSHVVAPWYVAVPVFLIVIAVIGYLAWIISGKKLDSVMFVLAITLLIAGFTLFNISAAISVISITIGIILAGILTLFGIAGSSKD